VNIRLTKISRDLTTNKSRSLLIIIAVAIGVMAFGLMQTGSAVLKGNLNEAFPASRPAHAVMILLPFQDGLLQNVRRLSYVEAAEARTVTQAFLESQPDTWISLDLHAISDFNGWDINKITAENGAVYPTVEGSILLERSVRDVVKIGEIVRVKTLGGKIHSLKVAGFTNDLSMAPTSLSLTAYGYITRETAGQLGLPKHYNRLYVRVHGADGRAAIEKDITSIVKHLQHKGVMVYSAPVPPPGKQLLADSIFSVLMILGALGKLTLVLSAFLVTAVMFAVMNQQMKQIGILKSLGARTSQTMSLYFQQVLLYGLLALLFAIPLGALGGYFMADGVGDGMNLIVSRFFLPPSTLILQGVSAVLIPLLAASIPIRNGAHITIREAISDYSTSDSARIGIVGRLVSTFGDLSQLVKLSIRNAFRRPGRLALNFATLILAGAMFMAVIGIRQSLQQMIVTVQKETNYDVDLDFSKPYPKNEMEKQAGRLEGTAHVEAWTLGDARLFFSDRWLSGSINLLGVPADTQASHPKPVQGRFLLPDEKFAIFINWDTLDLDPDLKPGSVLRMRIGNLDHDWTVVGIGPRGFGPVGYVHYDDLVAQTSSDGLANRLVVQGWASDPASQSELQKDLLAKFNDAGYDVSHTATRPKDSTAAKQMDTLVMLLLSMVILIAAVGGLGLAITMGLNIMERTRELGILRSLGAQGGAVRRMVITEGLIIGVLSWAIAIPISVPLAIFLGNSLGLSLMAVPLDYIFSVPAVLIWLGLVVMIAIVASLIPAENAVQLTIRDTLMYE
jgi:putative ABC transport system permease protein